MSREETDREDLLREATALVERMELQLAEGAQSIVLGFRRNGCASFFFGVAPVYQFNTAGELRRLYVQGELLKAESRRLIALRRERNEHATVLLRRDLTTEEQQEIVAEAAQRLTTLRQALATRSFHKIGQVPDSEEVLVRALSWLNTHLPPWTIAAVPNAI